MILLLGCSIATQTYWSNPANQMQPQQARTNPAHQMQPQQERTNPAYQMQNQQARTNPNVNRQIRYPTNVEVTTQPPAPPPTINPFYEFNRKLFFVLGYDYPRHNMIFSPLSLQTLLGFIYTGAQAETAQELRTALELPVSPTDVAYLFQALIHHTKRQTSEDLKFNMVNNMYYKDYLGVDFEFYTQSIPFFEAEVHPMNFETPVRAAAQINKMVADKTNQRIKHLIKPETLYADTQAILVNAIYLKAKWASEFSASDTQVENFQVGGGRTVPVNMMYIEEDFKVGEIPGLNAKAIDLPFRNSNVSMTIILPHDIDGLARLEIALGNIDLATLNNFLNPDPVTLRLPKFKFEFDVDMSAPLMSLGISRLFSNYAQLDGFFKNQSVRIAKIQHKAYINVNEGGVEAAAASFGKLLPLSLPFKMTYFTVDRPFVFIIRSPTAVFFAGHVVRP